MGWDDEITIEDINERYTFIAELIGVKNFLKIARLLGGTSWYVPKIATILSDSRKRKIREEYNGYNIKYLATKYGLSERTIYYILEENKGEQLSLFEDKEF